MSCIFDSKNSFHNLQQVPQGSGGEKWGKREGRHNTVERRVSAIKNQKGKKAKLFLQPRRGPPWGQVGGPGLGITPLKEGVSQLKSDSFVQHVQTNSNAGKNPVILALILKTIIVETVPSAKVWYLKIRICDARMGALELTLELWSQCLFNL